VKTFHKVARNPDEHLLSLIANDESRRSFLFPNRNSHIEIVEGHRQHSETEAFKDSIKIALKNKITNGHVTFSNGYKQSFTVHTNVSERWVKAKFVIF
jgi:hypothetical protein